MHKQQFLIADPSDMLIDRMAQKLEGTFAILSCCDGFTAENILRECNPAFALLDLMLPLRDGLSVLKQIRGEGCSTRVVVSATLYTPYVYAQLETLGVEFTLRKPYSVDFAADTIQEIAGTDPRRYRMRQLIRPLLLALGIRPGMEGFELLCACLEDMAMEPEQQLIKYIYAQTAGKYDVTPETVERCVRSAIQNAWQHRDGNVWRIYLPDITAERPANAAFLWGLAEVLKNN